MVLRSIKQVDVDGPIDVTDIVGIDQSPTPEILYAIEDKDSIVLMGSVGFLGDYMSKFTMIETLEDNLPSSNTRAMRKFRREFFGKANIVNVQERAQRGRTQYFVTLPDNLLRQVGLEGKQDYFLESFGNYVVIDGSGTHPNIIDEVSEIGATAYEATHQLPKIRELHREDAVA